jgi:hypothetical protein
MTKLVTLATLVGSLLVAGVASADTAPRADARTPAADRFDHDRDGRRDRMARQDGEPDRPLHLRADGDRGGAHQLRAGDGGCVGKAHGKGKDKGKRMGKRGPRRGDDRGAPGRRAQRPDPRDA